jgi:hypothetical protein
MNDDELRAAVADLAAEVEIIHLRMARIEKAVSTMAFWLGEAQTGFNAKDAAGIEMILKGSGA